MQDYSGVILDKEYAPIDDPAYSDRRPCDWCDLTDDTVAYVVQIKKYLCEVCADGWRFSGTIAAGLNDKDGEW